MALALESYGYRVIGAADGEQALRIMSQISRRSLSSCWT